MTLSIHTFHVSVSPCCCISTRSTHNLLLLSIEYSHWPCPTGGRWLCTNLLGVWRGSMRSIHMAADRRAESNRSAVISISGLARLRCSTDGLSSERGQRVLTCLVRRHQAEMSLDCTCPSCNHLISSLLSILVTRSGLGDVSSVRAPLQKWLLIWAVFSQQKQKSRNWDHSYFIFDILLSWEREKQYGF